MSGPNDFFLEFINSNGLEMLCFSVVFWNYIMGDVGERIDAVFRCSQPRLITFPEG